MFDLRTCAGVAARNLSAVAMVTTALSIAQPSCRGIGCDHDERHTHNVLKSATYSEGEAPPALTCVLLPPTATASTDLVIRGRVGDVLLVRVVDGTAVIRINECSSEPRPTETDPRWCDATEFEGGSGGIPSSESCPAISTADSAAELLSHRRLPVGQEWKVRLSRLGLS